tara:strand:+ start:1841 stop:2314 length:474 start_codon:yes stop_codon:yes gene_type:complete
MVVKGTMSVQEEYAEKSICYGCGPSNLNGLQIKSYRSDNGLDLWFNPKKEHQAFPGVINGGVIGSIFDCHGNWTAAISILDSQKLNKIPSTVTANYSVSLLRPTPFGKTLYFTGTVLSISKVKVEVELNLYVENLKYAEGKGVFVVVKKGHPAYHRW